MPRYTIALEEQLGLQRVILGYGDALWDVPKMKHVMDDMRDDGFIERIHLLLGLADPYYISQPIARMLEDAHHTLPLSSTVTPADLPTIAGWIWIDEPKGWKVQQQSPVGEDYYIKAFLWACQPDLPFLVVGFGRVPGHNDLTIMGDYVWKPGDTVEHNSRQQTVHENIKARWGAEGYPFGYVVNGKAMAKTVPAEEYVRIVDAQGVEIRAMFASLVHFMSQRVSRVSRNGLPRDVRRRLPDLYTKAHADPYINVVELRAVDYERHEDKPEGEGRDWSTRWIVRGHWHRYWYASEQRHKPKWIEPYIKGPEGLPVKGASKLFVVKR